MLHDPRFVYGGAYGAYKEEDNIDAGLEPELDVGDEGKTKLWKMEMRKTEMRRRPMRRERTGRNSGAKDTNNAMPESEQQPEVSQNSKSLPF